MTCMLFNIIDMINMVMHYRIHYFFVATEIVQY